jgi:hypothetical protein
VHLETGKIMSDGMAKAFIVCGWVAAGLNGVVTALVVAGGPAAGQAVAYAIPALYLALAYGIAKRSRICAVVAMVTFVGMRIEWYRVAAQIEQQRGNHTLLGFWISVSFFTVLYLLGVIGTFTWHSRHPAAAHQPRSA